MPYTLETLQKLTLDNVVAYHGMTLEPVAFTVKQSKRLNEYTTHTATYLSKATEQEFVAFILRRLPKIPLAKTTGYLDHLKAQGLKVEIGYELRGQDGEIVATGSEAEIAEFAQNNGLVQEYLEFLGLQ